MPSRKPAPFLKTFFPAFFLLLLAAGRMSAQCSMACSANVNINLDADCSVPMVPTDVLMGTPSCPGPYVLYLVTTAGDTLPSPTVTGQHAGKTLMATVWHPATSNKCMGTVHVYDSMPPMLTCMDLTVACNADVTPAKIGYPVTNDNCSSNVILSPPTDAVLAGPCSGNFTQRITRTWRGSDMAGNKSTCSQIITRRRATLADVVPPPRFDTIPAGTVATPSATGEPTIGGKPFDMAACDMVTGYNDLDTIAICLQKGALSEYRIIREWLTINHCPTAMTRRDTQYILVKDMTPPTLACPPNTTVSTVIDACFADIASLPMPIVSAPDSVSVSWMFGNGFGPWDSIPPGDYTLTYRASDCSHIRTCTTKLLVKDTQTPTAVLKPNRVVALSSSGIFILNAAEFDAGSNDNCASNLTFSASTDGVNFAPSVSFNCAQVGTQVMVQVKVCEANNPDNCTVGMVGVSVQDKLGPTLTYAPANITVDCLYDYTNPTVGGSNTPTFEDNCGLLDVELDLVNNVNACGSGTLRRIWTATDVHGNTSQFTQIVTVVNTHPLTAADITWPLNYNTTACGASLAVDSLPMQYRRPIVHDPGCTQIATSYTDQVFNIGGPACNKIMRKWSVVDWCQYDPNFPNAGGYWTYTQVLQVMDGVAPTLAVPSDLSVTVGPDCLTGAAVLPDATGSDCSTMLSISHNSTFATAPGANASGTYPLGTHFITFRATDGCGNATQKTTKITVLDNKPPTAICMNGLAANLGWMDTTVTVMLAATLFNAGSNDYCTPANQLTINIKKAGSSQPAAPTVAFGCSEKGTQIVELQVGDQKGNIGKCLTYVLIQDNLGICPITTSPSNKATVAGDVQTEAGKKVEGVNIAVTDGSNNALPVSTDSLGQFAVGGLAMHSNYNVKPERDGDDLNGVSTYDLSLLNKHILGVQPLPSAYKMIAADINRSGSITSFDMLELRKVLLGIYDQLPQNTSWRFVDKNFAFPDPANPFASPFPEVKTIANLSADSAAHFIGIKIGDLNGSAQTNLRAPADERSEMPEFELQADEQAYNEGDAFAFALKAANRQEITALAFTLDFDPAMVEFDDWAPGALPNLSDGNLSFHGIGEGKLTFCWGSAQSAETAPGQTLLLFSGRAKQATNLSEAIRLNALPTRTEAYGPDGEEMSVTLRFARADGTMVPSAQAYELYQNQPNPFTGATTIGFHLPIATSATLMVFDAAGRLVLEKTQAFERGHNEWFVHAHELPQQGVFSYRVSTENWTATRKMVRSH